MGLPMKVFVLVLCLVSVKAAGKNWAVLVAGSHTWKDYFCQAAVCHAYHTLIKAGFSNETIIVMMYDDIANNPKNPYPGKIIDRPNGTDVYKGVPKHYTKDEITTRVFFSVLTGNKRAIRWLIGREGKVIESGPEDNIFIYYVDHGDTRVLGMPKGPYLHARQFNRVLEGMYRRKKYNQVLIYVDACFSGSMFQGLLSPKMNVYATTAVGPNDFGWQVFCNDPVPGICLTGEYSCNWQRDTDAADTHTETIGTQFKNDKMNTKKSLPHEYGDMSIKAEVLSYFFGRNKSKGQNGGLVPPCRTMPTDAVPTPMAQMEIISRKLARLSSDSPEAAILTRELESEQKLMKETEDVFNKIAKRAFKRSKMADEQVLDLVYSGAFPEDLDYDCYEDAVDFLTGMCPNVNMNRNPYAISKLVSLARACNARGYKDVLAAVKMVVLEHPLCLRQTLY